MTITRLEDVVVVLVLVVVLVVIADVNREFKKGWIKEFTISRLILSSNNSKEVFGTIWLDNIIYVSMKRQSTIKRTGPSISRTLSRAMQKSLPIMGKRRLR